MRMMGRKAEHRRRRLIRPMEDGRHKIEDGKPKDKVSKGKKIEAQSSQKFRLLGIQGLEHKKA